jgi:hypothetical protein
MIKGIIDRDARHLSNRVDGPYFVDRAPWLAKTDEAASVTQGLNHHKTRCLQATLLMPVSLLQLLGHYYIQNAFLLYRKGCHDNALIYTYLGENAKVKLITQLT